jgi:hypothetical protein
MPRNLFNSVCACAVALALVSSNCAALAAGLEDIQGNWGLSDVPCDDIFKIKDGRMSLASSFGQGGGGFIVSGRQVVTPTATCQLLSSKESGDFVTFVLDCRTQITFETTQMSIRLVDADTLVRTRAAIPELNVKYRRCK